MLPIFWAMTPTEAKKLSGLGLIENSALQTEHTKALESFEPLDRHKFCHFSKHSRWTYFCVPLQRQGEIRGFTVSSPLPSKHKRQTSSSPGSSIFIFGLSSSTLSLFSLSSLSLRYLFPFRRFKTSCILPTKKEQFGWKTSEPGRD